jgi:hypothetical protein
MAAGTAVALLSAATTLMASATASAGVTAAAAAPAPAASQVSTASFGSAAGLLFGLVFVLLLAAVSFYVRVGATRRAPARVIAVPEARVARMFVPAFAE